MKNLKKGLAIAMALAMVTTVMPTMNVDAVYTTPSVSTNTDAENFLGTLNDYLAENGIDYTGIQVGVAYDGTTFLEFAAGTGAITNSLDAATTAAIKFFSYKTEEYGEIYYLSQVAAKAKKMVVTETGKDLYTIDAEGKVTAGSAADETVANAALISLVAKAIAAVQANGGDTKTNYEALEEALAEVIKVEEYEGALPVGEVTGGTFEMYSKDTYLAIKEQAQEMVDAYFGNTYDSNLKEYVEELKNDYKTFFFTAGVANDVTSSAIAAKIKLVTKTTDTNYKRYADEEAVEAIVEQYNDMLDTAKEVDKVVNAKYEATIALMKTTAKWNGKDKESLSKFIKFYDLADVAKNINSDMFAIIKDYKEEVLDVVLTLDTEKIGKTYFEATTKTPFASAATVNKLIGYLSAKDQTAGTTTFDDTKLGLLDIADDTTGKRYYDVIEARMTEVQDALKAVTTAIKGISVNNLNSGNIGKVNDAYKAIKKLTGENGKYVGNLTSEEADTVADQADFIEMLRTYALLNGIVSGTTTGWVDLGNGNWDFYEANGDVPTKWVAAGTNWYFVKDGHMLRNSWVAQDATGAVWYYVDNAGKMVVNTTIDGYAINANGEWHK